MRKLKILLITMDYPPPMGGIQIFTYNLEQDLKELGHEVRIANFDGRNINIFSKLKFCDFFYTPATFHLYFINPLHMINPYRFRNFVYNNLVYRESRSIINEFNPDIIHLVKPELYSSIYNCKIPFLVSCHSEEVINSYPVRYSLEMGSRIHCVSNFCKDLVLKVAPVSEKKIKVIYNAIDLAVLKNIKEYPKKKWIITICRLVKRKNIDSIIRAFKLLPDDLLKKYKYIIVGEGPEQKNLETLVKELSLGENIFFKGSVSETEKIKLLSNSMIFIMCPTMYKNESEGFGISFIEAQSFGIPVIGSNNGGCLEAIGSGGLIVKNELDIVEIAKSIEELLTDKELYIKLVGNIKKRIIKFDLKKHVKKVEQLYREILRECGS